MTTSLYIDETTKEKASQKARDNNLSFSSVVRILLADYVSGKIIIGARSVTNYEVQEIEVDSGTRTKMDSIVAKWRNKKK